ADDGACRDAWLWRLSWLAAFGFVLANSELYTVHYRTEMTEAKGLQIEAYEHARRIETLATNELNELRNNPRWDATNGCSNVTAPRSKLFCDQVHSAQARIQSVEAVLSQRRPAAKHARVATL